MIQSFAGKLAAAFVAMALVAVAAPASAQLIAADSYNADIYNPFNQTTVLQFNTQTGATGGNPPVSPGFVDDGDGDPAPYAQFGGNFQWDPGSPGNLTLDRPQVAYDDGSTGKGKFLGIPQSFGFEFRWLERELDPYTAADTYYMSAFLNPGGPFGAVTPDSDPLPGDRGHALVGFTNGAFNDEAVFNNDPASGNGFGLMFGFRGESADSNTVENPVAADAVDLVVRARDVGTGDLTDTVLLAGETIDGGGGSSLDSNTYLVMLKLETNFDGGVADRVTYWVNPSNLASEAAATESTLVTGSFLTAAMDQNDRIDQFSVAINDWEGGRSLFWDEIRFGYDFESVRGTLVESGVDGDYNNDGEVNAADYTVWRDNVGLPVTLPNDTTPGTVSDPDDYNVWANAYGDTPTPPASGVPEPTTALLAAAGLMAMGLRRR